MLKPTFNVEHVQWMVRENICLALIRERERLHEDLTTRPIDGVTWTIDSAIVYRRESQTFTLPLLIQELDRRLLTSIPALTEKTSTGKKQSRQDTPFGSNAKAKVG